MRTSNCRKIATVGVALVAMVATASGNGGSAASPGAPASVAQAFAKLPVAFVENRGQADSRVRYYAQGSRFAFFLTQREIVLAFLRDNSAGDGHAVALRFIDGNSNAVLRGERAPGTVNYLRGINAARWQTQLSRYEAIEYRNLWPGIDLRVREHAGTLKYQFHVAAGADPALIRLTYDGASSLALDESGGLRVDTPMGGLRDAPPVSYQTVDGVRVPVESRYVLDTGARERRFGFTIGSYRKDRELVIDPGVDYTTLLGGASHEMPGGIAVDAAGNAYVVGFTQSPTFPTTAGAFRPTGAAGTVSDVFVTKLNPTGTALMYSTFVGGGNFDFGRRIAVDAGGNAYVTGQTKSSNFPTTGGAFDRTFNIRNCPRCGIDQSDAFVFKLNAAGSALVYSTFLGGTEPDSPRGIAVDAAGNAYVTGETVSSDFPTTAGAFRRTPAGGGDAFVTKLNAAGSALVYSTFLGGANVDNAERIAVDAGGRAHVLGFTSSIDFPTTPGAFDTTPNGGFDVSVTKLNAAGSGLVYSTLLGGQGGEFGGGLVLDAAGNAYISGTTASADFPTTPGAFDTTLDGSDVFAVKLNPGGSSLIFSTFLGGTAADGANGIAADAAGNVWLTGVTSSPDFPVTVSAAQPAFRGLSDAFVSELNTDGSALLFSTFLGGSNAESGNDVATDPSGDAYVTGHTISLDFPATTGAFDTAFNGDPSIFWGDGFVTRIAADTDTSTPPAPPPVPAVPALVSPPNGDAPPQPITFDWNDAVGAASYTIQIDDSSAFTAPLVRDAVVATSMYATTGLSTATHFWRVRGVNVDGVAGPWSTVGSFTPQAAPPPATLASMDTNPSTVVGGNASFGTVVLSVGAPDGGALVTLSSSNPAVAGVPATVTVPANGFARTFTIATVAVTTNTSVTITGSYNGHARSAALVVTTEAGAVSLQSLMLMLSTVAGGSGTQGVVRLSAGAPPAGAVVALSSSNPGVASVPSSVTVAPGAVTGVFDVPTTAVAASTLLTISAAYGGATLSADLSVTPPAPPPPQAAALTVTATGRSGVRVRTSPAGIDVATGTTGSASFAIGTAITLSMTDGRDAIFSGACSSSDKVKTCTFTLNGPSSVTVNVQ